MGIYASSALTKSLWKCMHNITVLARQLNVVSDVYAYEQPALQKRVRGTVQDCRTWIQTLVHSETTVHLYVQP